MPANNKKHIFTATYTSKKKYSKEIAQQIFDLAAQHEPSSVDRHIVLEKHYNDTRGNTVFELYKEELSSEEQVFYNRFYQMARHGQILEGLINNSCCDYYYSERDIQDLYISLRESLA